MSEPVYIVFGSYDSAEDLGDQICGIYTTLSDAQEARSQASRYDEVWIETWSTGKRSSQLMKTVHTAYLDHVRGFRGTRTDHYADQSVEITDLDVTSEAYMLRGGHTEAEAEARLEEALRVEQR